MKRGQLQDAQHTWVSADVHNKIRSLAAWQTLRQGRRVTMTEVVELLIEAEWTRLGLDQKP